MTTWHLLALVGLGRYSVGSDGVGQAHVGLAMAADYSMAVAGLRSTTPRLEQQIRLWQPFAGFWRAFLARLVLLPLVGLKTLLRASVGPWQVC